VETYWIIFIVFFCVIIPAIYAQRQEQQRHIMRTIRKRKGARLMSEALQRYVGKTCVIYYSSSGVTGIVKSIDGCWLTIDSGKPGKEKINMINTDYITRIQEK